MSERVSRLKRDVRSETSAFNRDVSSKRHGSNVTFQREPSFLSSPTATTHEPDSPETSSTESLDPAPLFAQLLYRLADQDNAGRPVPCRVDPEPFASDDFRERAEATQACSYCPLLDLCGAYAKAAGERWHVWAGADLTPTTRKEKQ